MDIIYELNPPKIIYDQVINIESLNNEIEKFLYRAQSVLKLTPFMHITDSVLGIPRISSIHGATMIKENCRNQSMSISCSVRTRDRNINSLIQLATESVFLKIRDLLFIMGDKPTMDNYEVQKPLTKPTDAVKILGSLGYNHIINLNLSVPNKVINFSKIKSKVESNPHSVITQSIASLQEIEDLAKILKPYFIKLIPCIMIPSEKNEKAAKMIGLNWKHYESNFCEFIKEAGKYVEKILITSPNDFKEGIDLLSKLKGNYQ